MTTTAANEKTVAPGAPLGTAAKRARRPALRGAGRRLVVVSNRLPELVSAADLREKGKPQAGGLVTALRPALEAAAGGLWVGWSGRSVPKGVRPRVRRERFGRVTALGIDLAEADVEGHYNGFCNGALWPLCHSFPERVRIDAQSYGRHRRVNRIFARAVARLLAPGDRVWVHDYHLFPLARELRALGVGRATAIGFFLHVPFPPHDVFSILPWAAELLEDLCAYDLVGFQTARYAENYEQAVERELGAREGRPRKPRPPRQRVGAYPIGIDPRPYEAWSSDRAAARRAQWLREAVRGRRIILGVDRLDYTKGIAERLRAFARLLERFPRWRSRVSFIQISAPSRTRVADYIRHRREIEELVGHVNGRFGEADWVPIRYLFRSYEQRELAAFYREADVCFVSPLRDGMNLVAKEYVACQAADPGVLVLSRFAGAAEELKEAVLVNPYDLDGTAAALDRALRMPREERERRQAALLARVRRQTAQRWAARFLADLAAAHGRARRAKGRADLAPKARAQPEGDGAGRPA